MIYSRILSTGSYLPSKVVTNHDLEKQIDTTHEWIYTRTGIEKRHIAASDESTCDLAEQAANRALESGELTASEIDLVVIATTTADQVFPSTACLLQERLGIAGPPAFRCAGCVRRIHVRDRYSR